MAAIGGKDSMSGTFENLTVPPTLVSFAVTTAKLGEIASGEFKRPDRRVVLLCPAYGEDGLPRADSLLEVYDTVHELLSAGRAAAAYTPTYGGVAEAVMTMCFGNGVGFAYDEAVDDETVFGYRYGSFVLELTEEAEDVGRPLGRTMAEPVIRRRGESVTLEELLALYEGKLESVYACNIPMPEAEIPCLDYTAGSRAPAVLKCAAPRVLIPVFPGTNCEYDSAKAFAAAGAVPETVIIRNLTSAAIADATDYFARRVADAQMIFIPGGFSGGDEPDGSGKFITAFFRSAAVKRAVGELLDQRGGLMAGICNGFQALIKLGLVPYGRIIDTDESCPTLTYNVIGRHQSRIVPVRVASDKSPWLAQTRVGDVYNVPISHGEGRFYASEELIRSLAANGQIATQYVDLAGRPTMDVHFNPNGSVFAVEGITSPDGRIFGKMGHAERIGAGLYQNVPGEYDMKMFASTVEYFR
jgi:phosphoribosylformylglycinamidine synthase